MDQELREYLDGFSKSNDARFSSMELQLQEFRRETAQRFEQVETQIRHTNVLVEDLRGQIQLVAEGVANCNERLDRLEEKVDRGFAEEKATRTLHEGELERRLRLVEKPQE